MAEDRDALLEQLDVLVTWLECGDADRPELFGSRDEYEWLLRLTGVTRSLLARHHTDADGRCAQCRERRRGWRSWIPPRRVQCQVMARVNAFTTSALDEVWWQVLSQRGDDIHLQDVRAWLDPAPEEHATAQAKHARLIADERVRPYVWGELPTGREFSRPDDAETQELPLLSSRPC
jgi:hypothetical protein